MKINLKSISIWMKVLIIGFAICGIAVFGFGLHEIGVSFAENLGEPYGDYVLPWEILFWVTAIPCYIVLVICWLVSNRIKKDLTFSNENARHFKWISILAGVDTVIFFVGNFIFLFLNMSHPGIFLVSLVVDFVGFAIAVGAALLSRLISKAAQLQDEIDLTV